MKKLLIIVAMALMAVGASAQNEKLLYEVDWSEVGYSFWSLFSGPEHEGIWEATDEGLAITNPQKQEQMSYPLTLITQYGEPFSLEEGHDYFVRLTLKVPSDGSYYVQLGDWASSWYDEVAVTASDDWQVIDIENSNYYSDISGAHVLFGNGWVVGTTILKKVEVYERFGENVREDGTAIHTVKTEKANDTIYNLSGQRVDAFYKGVVIKNGKKYHQ